ncbi:MAG: tryptophan 7-halogenase [Myxococcales bacterium]|nr:tryptophan 7-halogenase [Myxococcales bacterium]
MTTRGALASVRSASSEPVDVVVIGGGPGGAVCAAELARRGRRVLVVERETSHESVRMGESLVPASLDVFASLGLIDRLRERFVEKRGAWFHDDRDDKHERFGFEGAIAPRFVHAFEAPRDELDATLLERARELGAAVVRGASVSRVDLERAPREVRVTLSDGDGPPVELPTRAVVDASGRAAVVSRARSAHRPIAGLHNTSLFAHFRGVERREGDQEGDIEIVILEPERRWGRAPHVSEGPSATKDPVEGWAWLIPFKDGRTSVGFVVQSAWIRDARAAEPGADPARLFELALDRAPTARAKLGGAERLFAPRALTDFSYSVDDIVGPGWLAVGDAAGFIDPLFSTGVHLAVVGGERAGAALDAALATGEVTASSLAGYASEMRGAMRVFTDAVRAFYAGELASYLFAPNKRTVLRRSITSLLAGDVMGDPVWLRDVAARVARMAERA